MPFYIFDRSVTKTGNYRCSQISIDINQLLCGLGVITPAIDPYTGLAIKILNPIRGDVLNEKYFVDNKWEDWDRSAWQDLIASYSSILLSDDKEITNLVNIPALNSLAPIPVQQVIFTQQILPSTGEMPQVESNSDGGVHINSIEIIPTSATNISSDSRPAPPAYDMN